MLQNVVNSAELEKGVAKKAVALLQEVLDVYASLTTAEFQLGGDQEVLHKIKKFLGYNDE